MRDKKEKKRKPEAHQHWGRHIQTPFSAVSTPIFAMKNLLEKKTLAEIYEIYNIPNISDLKNPDDDSREFFRFSDFSF